MCLKLFKLNGNGTKMPTNFMQKDAGSLLDQLMCDHVSRCWMMPQRFSTVAGRYTEVVVDVQR
jgi:hypothetical protein